MRLQPTSLPVVSLIVPLRDDKRHVGRCLQSLIDQDYQQDKLEIIVVDGRSGDGSRKIVSDISARDSRVKVIDNPRLITAAAANIGLKAARGDVLGIVSSHCALDPDYVSRIVGRLRQGDIACAAGGMKTVGSGYLGCAIALALSSVFGVGGSKFRTGGREQFVDTAAFGLYQRAIFEDIGLFDERLVRNEDNDLHYRLRQSGRKLLLTPAVNSYYYAPDSISRLTRQAFNNGKWNIRLLRLTGKGLSPRHLIPFVFVLTVLATGVLTALGRPQPLAAMSIVYCSAALLASVLIGIKNGPRFAAILPGIFLSIHLSYGVGSLVGLIETLAGRVTRQAGPFRPDKLEKLKQKEGRPSS